MKEKPTIDLNKIYGYEFNDILKAKVEQAGEAIAEYIQDDPVPIFTAILKAYTDIGFEFTQQIFAEIVCGLYHAEYDKEFLEGLEAEIKALRESEA